MPELFHGFILIYFIEIMYHICYFFPEVSSLARTRKYLWRKLKATRCWFQEFFFAIQNRWKFCLVVIESLAIWSKPFCKCHDSTTSVSFARDHFLVIEVMTKGNLHWFEIELEKILWNRALGTLSRRFMTLKFKDIINNTQKRKSVNSYFAVYGFENVCEISKVPLKLNTNLKHRVHTRQNIASYEVLKFNVLW